MDIVKLRKLAHKSIWYYGKYQGYTVSNIMITNKRYLIWAYYNLEKISFIDEILDDFSISYKDKFKRIDKPGKDPDYYEDNISFSYDKLSKKELFNLITANRINGKKSSRALYIAYNQAKSKYNYANRIEVELKSSLQAINHGNAHELKVRRVAMIK